MLDSQGGSLKPRLSLLHLYYRQRTQSGPSQEIPGSGAQTYTWIQTHVHPRGFGTGRAHPFFLNIFCSHLEDMALGPFLGTLGKDVVLPGPEPCSAAAVLIEAVGAEQIKRSNRACGRLKVVAET